VQNPPLRFDDEFVRHKVLDLIGDLALAGRRIQGRVVAERAGHAMHTALVQRLMRDRSAWELAYGYDEEPVTLPATAELSAESLRTGLPVHA
jgi:UDP-3-O-[3-hydroxymyristoyl] N-acetylglucosamine deacetylase